MTTNITLLELIREDGVKGSIRSLAAAMLEYAHEMSDQGLKEKSLEAAEAADILYDVEFVFEENDVEYEGENDE